jgi:hypothetical protein
MTASSSTSTICQRLHRQLEGPNAELYRAGEMRLDHFLGARYEPDVGGIQQATIDLTSAARYLRIADCTAAVRSDTAAQDPRRPWLLLQSAVLNDERTVLMGMLVEFEKQKVSVGIDDVALSLDNIVAKLLRPLNQDPANVRKWLLNLLRGELRRLGILPTGRTDATAFIEDVYSYIDAWMV